MFSASSLPPSPHDEANEFAHRSSPSSTLMLSYSSPSKAAFAAAQRAYPAEIKKHLRIALRVRRFVVDDDGDDDDNLGTDANAPTVTPAIRWRCLRGLWADLGLPEDLLGKAVQVKQGEKNRREFAMARIILPNSFPQQSSSKKKKKNSQHSSHSAATERPTSACSRSSTA